ncbi:hypothetical protein TWF569_003163 [Orbilia oligospora]|uniref:Uncharacterized protein n=1 Tax=Orbilia oligospora TaxID=2813651 RepID=A0A7C8J2E2_ORBOL|nr:hypothetical protein TWF706_003397 [Orbilia oligospora]KAF3084182.1 hypothetical protein TWF102_000428 [Orbilia oligospora]KAF3113738.1 hypothetical protein TWF103_002084 [Orbilia oligospora]KAF3120427.1 hypothetical protein TWF569_003163 [Orbilia oligospora]KAF3153008.1 hypothetical protein TWF594_000055 [Orbilia oligospora]
MLTYLVFRRRRAPENLVSYMSLDIICLERSGQERPPCTPHGIAEICIGCQLLDAHLWSLDRYLTISLFGASGEPRIAQQFWKFDLRSTISQNTNNQASAEEFFFYKKNVRSGTAAFHILEDSGKSPLIVILLAYICDVIT